MVDLLSRVRVEAAPDLTAAYPERTSVRVHVTQRNGQTVSREQSDFEGSPTRPMTWDRVVEKFAWLSEPFVDDGLRDEIVSAVDDLDTIAVSDLTELLAKVSPGATRSRTRGRL